MDEQTSPATEPAIMAPDPVVTDTSAFEPSQDEPEQAVSEPVSAPQTAQTEQPSEPIPESRTAQMAGNEPLATSEPQGAGGSAEAPQPETPANPQGTTSQPAPTPVESAPASMPAQAPVIAPPPRNLARVFLAKAQAVIQQRKQNKLLKIMNLFEKKKHITNDEVEKLLHVSDATATRYLSHLEKEGKIKQTGKTGHAVSYTKV